MLDELYMYILDMSKTAGFVILAVMAARLLLKRAPRVISYALWAVVLLRLLCPLEIKTPVSIVPEMPSVSEDYGLGDAPVSIAGAGLAAYQAVGDALNGGLGVQYIPTTLKDPQGNVKYVTAAWWDVWILFGQYVWLVGMAAMAVYSAVSYVKLRKKLAVRLWLRDNIYLADDIDSAFVVGLLHPKIFLPNGLGEREQGYIILHEQHHIRRWDHIWKALAFLALTLHWFNPLVWAAFILACRDMEMSCDEAVIRKLGEDARADYSATLLTLATGKRIIAGTPIAFGEGDPKGRIRNLAKWKKPVLWITAVAIVLCTVLSICLLTDPVDSSLSWEDMEESLHEAILDAILERNKSEKEQGLFPCASFVILANEGGGEANRMQDASRVRYITVYGLAMYQAYSMENGVLTAELGSHIPVAISFTREDSGEYVLTEYWQPRDGKYYAVDIREKFPRGVEADTQKYVEQQLSECLTKARAHFEVIPTLDVLPPDPTQPQETLRPTWPDQLSSVAHALSLEELPADYTPEQAAADGCVVMIEGDIWANSDIWIAYTIMQSRGQEASVRCADFRSDPRETRIYDISTAGRSHVYRCLRNGEITQRTYPGLHVTGRVEPEKDGINGFKVWALSDNGLWGMYGQIDGVLPYDSCWDPETVVVWCDLIEYREHPTLPEKLQSAEITLEGKTVASVTDPEKLVRIRDFFAGAEGYPDEPKTYFTGPTLTLTGTDGQVVVGELDQVLNSVRIDSVFYFYGEDNWNDDNTLMLLDMLALFGCEDWPEWVYAHYEAKGYDPFRLK